MGEGSVAIAITIAGIFILLGGILPYIQAEFDITATEYDASDIVDPSGANTVNFGTILLSILSMFFWTFGTLPFYIDLILVIFRVGFIIALVDIIWIG